MITGLHDVHVCGLAGCLVAVRSLTLVNLVNGQGVNCKLVGCVGEINKPGLYARLPRAFDIFTTRL